MTQAPFLPAMYAPDSPEEITRAQRERRPEPAAVTARQANSNFLRVAFPALDCLQRTKIYGPQHPDGGEYAPVCEVADENLARGMVAAYNAFDSAAQKLGVNAVELAERMANGGIAELVTAFEELVKCQYSEGHPYGQFGLAATLRMARAAISKVKGEKA